MKVLCRIFLRIFFLFLGRSLLEVGTHDFFQKNRPLYNSLKKSNFDKLGSLFSLPQKKNPLYVLKSKISGQKMKKIAKKIGNQH